MSVATRPSPAGDVDSAPPPIDRTRLGAVVAGLGILGALAILTFEPLPARALLHDLGIQFHLSEQTAGGAVPLLDFEHGWNAGAWYFGAFLHVLAGGDPDVWAFLWREAFGSFLAAACILLAGLRARLPAGWLLGLVAATLVLTSVVHAKYAVPATWLVLLVPAARALPLPWAVGLRFGMAAVTAFAHLELAIMLGAGLAMYELFGSRRRPLRDRVLRAAAAPAGVVVLLVGQMAVYAALGLAPGAFLRQLFGQAAVDPDFHFGYPLLAPEDVRMWLFPAGLVVAFVPVVWRRLSEPSRLVACLNLALALSALRRAGPAHVAAVSTLLAPLIVFGARDLVRAARPSFAGPPVRAVLFSLLGAAWFVAALLVGFRVDSLLALAGLGFVALLGIGAAHGGDRPWMSAGALLAIGVFLVAGLAGSVRSSVADAEEDPMRGGDRLAEDVAAAVAPALDDCTGGDDRVWVVPYPLGLYRELDLTNPTPFVMFWYPFRGEHERVHAMVEAGDIPTILLFNRWPLTFDGGLVEWLQARYDLCAEVPVEATGDRVEIWTHATQRPDAAAPEGG